jgi:CHAT domain-containing protein
LTASEVASLRIAADWVVLSACNTASGSDAGAEALSGLARAFFYAGARSLLVSHWAVDSEAALGLTTRTFAALTADPKLGRAEAFRRTMLGMIEAGREPMFWAPFVIIGEGVNFR